MPDGFKPVRLIFLLIFSELFVTGNQMPSSSFASLKHFTT